MWSRRTIIVLGPPSKLLAQNNFILMSAVLICVKARASQIGDDLNDGKQVF